MKYLLTILLLIGSAFSQNTREYYVSGKLQLEGSINERGHKIGTWNEFYENGRLKSTTQYNRGDVVSKIEYTRKGSIEHEIKYDGYGYISYEKTPQHTIEYVKGIVRYIDGVSQWNYECDNVVDGIVTKTLCGYVTSLGSRVGYWHITSDQPEADFVKSVTRYAVYDTTRSTTLMYLKDEACFTNSADCTIGIIKSNEYTLYYLDKNTNKYLFNNSLSWRSDHSEVFSSMNNARHLTMDNCDGQEYMPNKQCREFVKYKSTIKRHEELFNSFK